MIRQLFEDLHRFSRRLFRGKKILPVPYDWIVMKDGRDIARLHEPEWLDLFWRRPILTLIEPTPEGVNLFDDAYWWDCTYQVRHVTLDLEAPHAIIQIAGDPPRVLVRGIPEAIPEENWPMNRTTK